MSKLMLVLQPLMLLLLPLTLGLWLRRRWRLTWTIFGHGALAFGLSKLVQLPTQWLVVAQLPAGAQLPVALAFAPLCEESARYLVLRRIATTNDDWRRGVFFGLGHGGVEAMLLGALVAVTLLGAAAVPTSAAEYSSARLLLHAPAGLRLLALLERAAAMIFHCGASLLVLWAVQRQRPILYVAAMALHYALNAAAVVLGTSIGPLAGTAAAAGVASIPLLIIVVARLRAPRERDRSAEHPDTTMAVSARGLGRVFGGVTAVEAMSFDVPRGQLFALLGPNGAGKTTMVRMLTALIPPTSGAAAVAGFRVGEQDDDVRAAIGATTEVPGLYEELSPVVNLRIFGGLEGVEPSRLEARIEELLRRFDLWKRRDDRVGSFSKGMRQKVSIARALLHEPPVIFLDEPTSGLDPTAARDLTDLIIRLKERGHTIFLTTHRLAEAEALADQIAIIDGRLIAVDSLAGLTARYSSQRVSFRFVGGGERWQELLATLAGVQDLRWEDGALVAAVDDPHDRTPALVHALVTAGAQIREVRELRESLESIYLQLVAGTHEEADG